jgi:hypothetical protein
MIVEMSVRNDLICKINTHQTLKINSTISSLHLLNERCESHNLRDGYGVFFRTEENAIRHSVADTIQSIGTDQLGADADNIQMIDARQIYNNRVQSTAVRFGKG